jgi:glycosyltransferase involved in cell wall biosynthesis
MKPELISVIVTTYNRPDALVAVLRGLKRQSDRNFEVLVADDGSKPETGHAIAGEANASPIAIRHLWQADEGFRAAAARNKGIVAARGDYLIFLDGDCVPQRDFVARHRALAEPGRTVTGSRILLSESFTRAALASGLDLAGADNTGWLGRRLRGEVNKLLPFFLRLPNGPWRHREGFAWRRIKSCNLATWKADALRVNGFDETFAGWGHEDADFVLRLLNAGIKRKDGALATEVLHLWHKEARRDRESINRQRVAERLRDGTVRAEQGIAETPADVAASAERKP